MRKISSLNINFVGNLKKYLIGSAAVMLVGIIIAVIFGIKLDINFKGGSRFTYTHSGDVSIADADAAIEAAIGQSVNVTESSDITGGSTKLVVTLVVDEALSTDTQASVTTALQEAFPDSNIELGDSNSVSPTIAGGFFLKSIVAVLIAAILVIIYTGIRFRKIGGISAGVMALFALIHDVLIAFFFCVIFRLEIDSNFIAVVLTILGYSLNDTIVIYDRIRENHRLYPARSRTETVNESLNQTLGRTITTTITTFAAIITVAVVAELFGLTSLRTLALPMAIGLISGCYSSVCLSAPLWVRWCEFADRRRAEKPKNDKKSAKK